jgi:hypothetical protein
MPRPWSTSSGRERVIRSRRLGQRCDRRVRRACLGSLAALGLLVGGEACGDQGASQPAPRTAPLTAPVAPGPLPRFRTVTRVEPRQRAAFALLRTPSEGIPAGTRRRLGRPLVGGSWRLAQRIPVALPGAYWLVPANRHVCVVAQRSAGAHGPGTTCARTADAVAHGVAHVTIRGVGPDAAPAHPRRSRLIVGVAPDGARRVLVRTRGEVATVPVVHGTFVRRDANPAPPDDLRLR